MPGDLLRAMAADLGVPRMNDESDTRFACRVSYSALRFWMQAYCLDDGYGGAFGISESTILRNSTIWLRNLSDLYPDLLDWYRFNIDSRAGLSSILHTLTDVRDLAKTVDGLYRCTARHTALCGTQSTLVLGMIDPTNQSGTLPISGMAICKIGTRSSVSLISNNNNSVTRMFNAKALFQPTHDERYVKIKLTTPLPNSLCRSQFNMLTWPILTAIDQQHRLARAEYVSILSELFRSNGIRVYEQKDIIAQKLNIKPRKC